jgi:hypothetical protein
MPEAFIMGSSTTLAKFPAPNIPTVTLSPAEAAETVEDFTSTLRSQLGGFGYVSTTPM